MITATRTIGVRQVALLLLQWCWAAEIPVTAPLENEAAFQNLESDFEDHGLDLCL
jgi:hypothetical protein